MGTAASPALDMNKLNAFVGQFVGDLGAAVHAGMVDWEKLGLYKPGRFTVDPENLQQDASR